MKACSNPQCCNGLHREVADDILRSGGISWQERSSWDPCVYSRGSHEPEPVPAPIEIFHTTLHSYRLNNGSGSPYFESFIVPGQFYLCGECHAEGTFIRDLSNGWFEP